MRPVWWLPTFGFFLFLSIELWMFWGTDRLFEDPAIGRHLRTAEVILETGQVPRVDPLSFTHAGEPWMDFEWAFEATLGELYRAGGLALVAAFCYALFAATLLGIYRTLLHSGLSVTVVLLYTGMAFLTLHLHFEARPLLFTYLFMALVVEVWYRRAQPLKRDWLILPIVFVAWANLHAGWAAALLFLGGSILGRLLDRIFKRVDGEEAPLIPWIGLTLLCLLATWFNPWGWGLHRQVFLFATTYKSFALWDEYAPPNFTQPNMSAIAVLFLLGVVILARIRARALRWRWEMALPFFFFLYEGLKAQRHVLLLIEVAAVPVARDLEALLHGTWLPWLRERLKEFQDRQRLAGGDAWLALVAALVIAAIFVRTPDAQTIEVGKSITPKLLTFLREHPDRFQRPLTTTWNAGPLLWNMRPDFRVSFDDRGDFYGDETVFSFVHLYAGAPGWRDTLEKDRYDSAILDRYLQLNKLLPSLPGWKEVYRDDKTIVYWKDG
ncbi:hypothetical protein OAG63_00210 [Methylacidiphilales bacterium]|nr:hypothetical protein [Candidatus Methylacidiphilales bacterium]